MKSNSKEAEGGRKERKKERKKKKKKERDKNIQKSRAIFLVLFND